MKTYIYQAQMKLEHKKKDKESIQTTKKPPKGSMSSLIQNPTHQEEEPIPQEYEYLIL